MATKIQFKRGLSTSAEWPLTNLSAGEPAFLTDSGKLYIGNGSSKILINPTYGSAASRDVGNSVGEIPVLDVNGKFPSSTLPPEAISKVYTVPTPTDMTNLLDAHLGDLAIVTGSNVTFALQSYPATNMNNWKQLLFTPAPVTSVAGKTGAVLLYGGDMTLQGYTKAASYSALTTSDSVNVALGKLEAGVIAAAAPVTSVNTLTGAVVLTGSNINMTGYTKAASYTAILATDSVNVAIGKLEAGIGVVDGGTF